MSASMPQSFKAGPAPNPGTFADGRGEVIADRSAGKGFRATLFVNSDRARELARREAFFTCTQHDFKQYDFDGRAVQPGRPYSQPLLNSEAAPFYVPLRMRRPSSPYRLGRIIVRSFTTMVFGEDHWPAFTCPADEDTQDFAEALIEATSLPVKMMQARDVGGSCGTVGLSWCYHEGKPRVDVHYGRQIHVHEWANRDDLIPAHVSEIYRYHKDEFDETQQKVVRNWYWFRRDWTQDADVYFKDVLVTTRADKPLEPVWVVDQERSFQHDDGECHFVWIQNKPTNEEDGIPDYDGCYENLDFLDILYSVLGRGTVVNLDPTLVLKMDLDFVQRMGVKKGSDNSLVVGKDGDASYMELGGQSVTSGLALFDSKKRSTLETAQCIVLDPSTLAASGTSGVALKMIYAPMTSCSDTLREQYGTAIVRLLSQMIRVAQAHYGESIVTVDDDGNEEPGQWVVDLPPKVVREPVLDQDGKPTSEEETKFVDRQPGEGTAFKLVWGPWFAQTSADQASLVTALSTATGMKPFMSPESATELLAAAFNRDPAEEVKRMKEHSDTEDAKQMQMLGGGIGGEVQQPGDLPAGATPAAPKPGEEGYVPPAPPEGLAGATSAPAEAISIPLTSTDVASVVTVNEYRQHTLKLGPLTKPGGADDPDGFLTITEFKAKRASDIAKAAQADKGQDPAKPPPTPPPFGGFGGKPPGAASPFGSKPPGAAPPFGAKPDASSPEGKPQTGLRPEDDEAAKPSKPPTPPKQG
jgi:hypothetical protein